MSDGAAVALVYTISTAGVYFLLAALVSPMIIELTFSTIMMLALIGLSIDGTRWILLQMETRFLSMTAAQAGAVALDGQSPHALTDAYQRANDMIAVNTTLLDSR